MEDKAKWSDTQGKNPIVQNLEDIVDVLDDMKVVMENDLQGQLKTLRNLMRTNISSNPKYRVKKNGH